MCNQYPDTDGYYWARLSNEGEPRIVKVQGSPHSLVYTFGTSRPLSAHYDVVEWLGKIEYKP